MWRSGSSPLARGAHRLGGGVELLARLIPARAGSTGVKPDTPTLTRAHPRSRGEHVRASATRVKRSGSSPLARGALGADDPIGDEVRLIPARAGSTRPSSRRRRPARAHPRSRGEHRSASCAAITLRGSSPLARGARPRRELPAHVGRLIPARAGSTCGSAPRTHPLAAHPRSRGEHGASWTTLSQQSGSSPLARGAHRPHPEEDVRPGLIPARAGSTGLRPRRPSRPRAHPRSRGEHPRSSASARSSRGSSPLARGARDGRVEDDLRVRLIPARAGSTQSRHIGKVLGGLIPARAGSTSRRRVAGG